MKTLSDKRRELYEHIKKNVSADAIITAIFMQIMEQDKQFIKDLKERSNTEEVLEWVDLCYLIDKLAGNKLIEEKEE